MLYYAWLRFIERGAEFNVVYTSRRMGNAARIFTSILRVMAQSDDYYGHNVPAQPLPHQHSAPYLA